MTGKDLRETLMGYPPDIDVQLAVNTLLHPVKQVDVCIDIDNNSKHRMADAKAHLEKLWNKLEVTAN